MRLYIFPCRVIIIVKLRKMGGCMIRRSTIQDSEIIWKWRNDEQTRLMSFSSDLIPWESHSEWYKKALNNSNRVIYIYELGNPVAVVRFDIEDKIAEISINVSPKHRGKGVGTMAIRESLPCIKECGVDLVIAKIKTINEPSIKCFTKVGFCLIEQNDNKITMELKL